MMGDTSVKPDDKANETDPKEAAESSAASSVELATKPRRLMPIQDRVRKPHSTSPIFKASSFAVTECRWSGISYSQ